MMAVFIAVDECIQENGGLNVGVFQLSALYSFTFVSGISVTRKKKCIKMLERGKC